MVLKKIVEPKTRDGQKKYPLIRNLLTLAAVRPYVYHWFLQFIVQWFGPRILNIFATGSTVPLVGCQYWLRRPKLSHYAGCGCRPLRSDIKPVVTDVYEVRMGALRWLSGECTASMVTTDYGVRCLCISGLHLNH